MLPGGLLDEQHASQVDRADHGGGAESLTVEQALKELKHDLAIRPIYHQTDEEIETHILSAQDKKCHPVRKVETTPVGGEHRCAKRHHSQTRGAGKGSTLLLHVLVAFLGLLSASDAETAAASAGTGADAAFDAGQDGGDPDGRCASAYDRRTHRYSVALHRTPAGSGAPALQRLKINLPDQLAPRITSDGVPATMTTHAVAPTCDATPQKTANSEGLGWHQTPANRKGGGGAAASAALDPALVASRFDPPLKADTWLCAKPAKVVIGFNCR